jgi:uncharacterized protein DUF1801
MADAKARKSTSEGAPGQAGDVQRFVASLDHPFKSEILLVRSIILASDARIAEGIKWNSLSFRATEYFATFHLRSRDRVQLILHRGAKKRSALGLRSVVKDPGNLLQWLGEDRATLVFASVDEIAAARDALTQLIRDWVHTL